MSASEHDDRNGRDAHNERMRAQLASGAWTDAADASLMRDHERAVAVMRRYNTDPDLDDAAREALLRDLFGAFGERSSLTMGAQVDYGYNIRVGKRCFFNYNCVFLDGASITFGDDVWVGPNCSFVTPLHPLVGRERAMRIDGDGVSHLWERDLPITVGDDVWIASNVTVNPGVTIGEGAVIESGSVVTKDVPPRTIAFGNPCRVARAITEDDSIEDALAAAGLLAR